LNFEFFNSALFKKMFWNTVLTIDPMSWELIAFEIDKISLILIGMISNETKILEKTWKCTVRKIQSHNLTVFSKGVMKTPILGFYTENTKNALYVFLK
jgi:hypothetical protein